MTLEGKTDERNGIKKGGPRPLTITERGREGGGRMEKQREGTETKSKMK